MQAIRRLSTVSGEDFSTNRERVEAIKVCQTLLTKLQDPFERVWEAVVDTPALVACIKLCLDLDLFRLWKESGNGDKSSHDLAEMVNLKHYDMLGKTTRCSSIARHSSLLSNRDRPYRTCSKASRRPCCRRRSRCRNLQAECLLRRDALFRQGWH